MLISIISPCFKAEKYLQDTYLSLVNQTYKNWEWIIVDDFSPDNSWNLIVSIASKDERVKAVRLSQNSGPSVCRNKGLELSRGEYIAFLDADDQWLPEKLEKQLSFMKINNALMSCHAYKIMSEEEEELKDILLPRTVEIGRLGIYNPLATSFMMIKRSAIDNLRFDEALRRRQDWVFWYQLVQSVGVCHNLNTYLGRYRKGSVNSISKNKIGMALLQWKMYRKYFKLGFIHSLKNFFCYACYGAKKHFRLKQLSPAWFTPIFLICLIVAAVAAVD